MLTLLHGSCEVSVVVVSVTGAALTNLRSFGALKIGTGNEWEIKKNDRNVIDRWAA
jgi:hypothetical protein